MDQATTEISSPVIKTAAAWGSVGIAHGVAEVAARFGINSWGDAAQAAAFALTACYLVEFVAKRVVLPLMRRLRAIKHRTRRAKRKTNAQ